MGVSPGTQSAGLSLREIRRVLAIADRGDVPCEHVVSVLQDRLDQVRATLSELASVETHLVSLLNHARTAEPIREVGVCWILDSDHALPSFTQHRGE